MQYRLFQDEYALLQEKALSLSEAYKNAGELIWEALSQSSETWHDNAPLDVARLSWELASKKLREVQDILVSAQIIKTISDECIVSMWKRITISIDGSKPISYIIGGYQTLAQDRISYNAPLIRPLLGKEEWESVSFFLNEKEVEVEILEVEVCLNLETWWAI